MLRTEERWMMRPPEPAAIIRRPTSWDSQNAPVRLASMTASQSSAGSSSALPVTSTLAQLTRTSMPGHSWATSATARHTLSRLLTSSWQPRVGVPCRDSRAAKPAAFSRHRPATATAAPWAASSSQIAEPSPP
jgi:hypothetical protein